MPYSSIERLKSIHSDIDRHTKRLLVGNVSAEVKQNAQKIKTLCADLERAIRDAEREIGELDR